MRVTSWLRCSAKHVQQLLKNDLNVVNEDKYLIHVRAGSGGPGISRYNGQGGKGGDVYLFTKPGMSFPDIKKSLANSMRLRAEAGTASQKTQLIGAHGSDIVFQVPVGVEAVDESRNVLLARCSRPYQRYLIARGGHGGCQANNFKGERGDDMNMTIHLKLRPNVGLVGFPNAGKSTLLKAFVPRKSVKIAPYPFTTVKPQIGFWAPEKNDSLSDEKFTLTLADLPGLIEGASRNRGKGYQFLKHLEYCDVLVFVVDCSGFQLSNNLEEPFRTPLETVALLNRELEAYDRHLVTKPAIVLINKIDIAKDPEEPARLASVLRSSGWEDQVPSALRPTTPLRFDYVIPISARSGEIGEVKKALLRLHKDLNPFTVVDEPEPTGVKRLV